MTEFVEKLILDKKELFKNHFKEMIASYDRELKTISGYNGRQLLELLQNCDDEGSKDVLIKLDRNAQTISISNNGTPFSREGYESLFTSDYSSKVSKKYIGNKGLGFRSIINWSNIIEIHSNGMSLTYTEENRRFVYNELFEKEQQQQFIKKRNFKKNIIPMPFISMPILSKAIQNEYVTTIVIHYKKSFLKDILEQVKSITPETILFLKHIEQINFEGFDNTNSISCKREPINKDKEGFLPKEKIIFKEHSWYIFEEENILPFEYSTSDKNEEEFYQIKIAVEENLSKSSKKMFSFFPTNIQIKQPYILHATFDLDPTRNQIDNSDKNKYILNKIVQFTIQVAKYYTKNIASYKPLEILNHNHKSDTLDNLGYYELIEEAIASEAIFPCVDNSYKKLNEIIYVNDEFGELLQKINATSIINIHLLPLKNKTLEIFNLKDKVDSDLNLLNDIVGLLNMIASLEMTVNERAMLIRLIIQNATFIKASNKNELDFLINKEGEIINGKEYIYTPVTQEKPLKTPSFTNIQFIKTDLFEALLNQLNFSESNNPNKGRFIYDELSGFCNIHSYEPATLSQKIIREANAVIERNSDNRLAYIQEMNLCLYHNFKLMKEDTIIPDDTIKIPSVTLNNTIVNTEELVLSEFYPTGKNTSLIFKDVYTDNNYVANPKDLGLDENEDVYLLEKYLKWIKINSYAKYTKEIAKDNGLTNYVNYVQRSNGYQSRSGYKIEYTNILNLHDILEKIRPENLILWVYYDEVLKKQLYDFNNTDVYKYFHFNYKTITSKTSYLKYFIETNYRFKFYDLLIDEKYSWVNNFKINYNEIVEYDSNVSKTIVNEILLSLGAKDDFKMLPIEKVIEIINKLPINYPKGKKSQTFYKKALSHYNENGVAITQPLKLFANNGSELALYNQNDIYFSEKIKLPNKLKKDFPIFNYPPRAGGAEAISFFGINDLKEIKIQINDKSILSELTDSFKPLLGSLKPFILSYRLNVIEDNEVRKVQASICKKIELILCDRIEYSVNEIDYTVADYEFLHFKEQTYYVKIDENDTIASLKKNVDFTNSFADIISLAFDVNNDKNEFKYIIRSDFDDVENSIKHDLGVDNLNEARELLGLADYKQAFWQAIFLAKGLIYNEQLDDLALEQTIKNQLDSGFDTNSLDYENLNSINELNKIELLFSQLSLSLDTFSKFYTYKVSLAPLHISNIKDAILSQKNRIKSSVWSVLKNKTIENQAQFLDEINVYENYQPYAKEKSEELKYQFRLDKNKIFDDYKNSIYPEYIMVEVVDLYKVKRGNESEFSEEELYRIDQSERFKSLIYFENALDTIKKELIIDNAHTSKEINNETTSIQPRILNSDLLKLKKPKKNSTQSGVYTPREINNRHLKQIGNKSEQVVYDFLMENEYRNVDFVSKDNEGLQCDIRYTNDVGIVKYIEVKTFDNGSFYLSKAEYDFGKNNQNDYEIWLVKNKQDIFKYSISFQIRNIKQLLTNI